MTSENLTVFIKDMREIVAQGYMRLDAIFEKG
jgi:hypothetical protein